MTLSNPRDLLLRQLSELLWIERTLVFEGLPRMIAEVRNADLRTALEEHLEETKLHATRVEAAIRGLDVEPVSARSAALAGLLAGHAAETASEPGLRDFHHVGGAIRVEHLEIGLYEAVGLLPENREDEERALERLRSLRDVLAAE